MGDDLIKETTGDSSFSLSDIIDPSRIPVLWLLIAFVITAVTTRIITRRIRAKANQPAVPGAPPIKPTGIIKNVSIGGIHVHHQVWGILLVLITGLLYITYSPKGIAANVLAAAFGVGAALALDEFAMWLYVEDVYWSNEGRDSISALMTAAAICTVLILGSDPLDIRHEGGGVTGLVVGIGVAVNLIFVVICILKGKVPLALIGVFFSLAALIGAIRLAKPDSWWDRKRYAEGSRKAERSAKRFGAAYHARWDRIQDFIGGAPTATNSSTGTH